jgi:hypothetical protein
LKANGWALVISLAIGSQIGGVAADENKRYLDSVIKEFQAGCKGKLRMEYRECWRNHSPEKCKSLVYGNNPDAWKYCVYSCGGAGFFSKNFGECSI